MGSTKPPYATAFKQQIVDLAMGGRTPAELSREFEVSAQSITAWFVANDGKTSIGSTNS